MKDDRFGKMFTDQQFHVDKASESYKLHKPQEGTKRIVDDVDSIDGGDEEVEEAHQKSRDLNKLFSGKGDIESEEGSAESDDDDFQSKLNKQERKKYRKNKNKDKILGAKPQQNSQNIRHLDKEPAKK